MGSAAWPLGARVAPQFATLPDTPGPTPRALPPLDLTRLVMRRAGLVAGLVVLLAVLLGVLRMNEDIDGEVDAAMALAGVVARLGNLAQAEDDEVIASLRQLLGTQPLRHLELQVHAADGRLLLGPPAPASVARPLGWLLALHRELLSAPDSRRVAWTVPRPGGAPWTVALAASHDSERREAMVSLLGMLLLLGLCVAGLLLAMRWNLRRALAPLGRLLDAIAGIEAHQPQAVRSLPTMPIRELEAVALALRHLGNAIESAEAQRRLLSQQVLTLQEDESVRLARELHDEFGQRLTALRVDAAWLARRVADQPSLKAVVDGMSQQCERVQQDIRSLLVRLQPFGVVSDAEPAGESLSRLTALLHRLVAGWATPGREAATAYRLDLAWQDAGNGAGQPWPEPALADRLCLPRPLLLAIYRISQEALTNVARHADATQVVLRLQCSGVAAPDAALAVAWSVCDDGLGLPSAEAALRRGNGIAGIQERVWALGGELQVGPAGAASSRPGLCLAAQLQTRLLPSGAARLLA